MDISINLTLFIQIFHFLIAYYLITKIFLKPALSVLKEEHNEYDVLNQSILKEKEILLFKEQAKAQAWKECQNYFKKNRPEAYLNISVSELDTSSIKRQEPLGETEKQKLINEIVKALKPKLIYD